MKLFSRRSVIACFSLVVLLPALVAAEGKPIPLIRSARSGPWSAPVTWEGGKVPGAGGKVLVRQGHTLRYDVSSCTW
jgi:hypothetical protein